MERLWQCPNAFVPPGLQQKSGDSFGAPSRKLWCSMQWPVKSSAFKIPEARSSCKVGTHSKSSPDLHARWLGRARQTKRRFEAFRISHQALLRMAGLCSSRLASNVIKDTLACSDATCHYFAEQVALAKDSTPCCTAGTALLLLLACFAPMDTFPKSILQLASVFGQIISVHASRSAVWQRWGCVHRQCGNRMWA
jgi:hypothetical protein